MADAEPQLFFIYDSRKEKMGMDNRKNPETQP
jgi:hypothetical protein